MTRNEQLRLAAVAADYKLNWITKEDIGWEDDYIVDLPEERCHWRMAGGGRPRWEPDQNNLQAFLLALDAKISVAHDEAIEVEVTTLKGGRKTGEHTPGVCAWCVFKGGSKAEDVKLIEVSVAYGDDSAAATREAILKVAVKLGELKDAHSGTTGSRSKKAV